MKKKMIILMLVFLTGLFAFGIAYYFVRIGILLTFAITFGTCFYHFAMRLAVGHGIDAIFHNKMNYERRWFRERKFESKLYNFLRVKKWKKHVPTYNPESYDLRKHSIEEVIQVTCQAEVVHEINMLLSYVPIILIIWFGSLAAFLITSIVACCIDGVFVILQRYNRPRLMNILRRKKSI